MASGIDTREDPETTRCPFCGEPVKSTWKLCPACEAPLGRLLCPGCRAEVRENWKICPECELRLKCPACSRRLPPGRRECPNCRQADAGRPQDADAFIEPITGMEFVLIRAGNFQMGDTHGEGWDNESPLREVRVDSFYLAKHPVTQGQWERLMATNPSMFRKGPEYPVEQVSWSDADEFIRRLNETTPGGNRFRLPTEAEWEYAARSGGRQELYAGGDDISTLGWYSENSQGSSQPVGLKAPNGLGLFDMSGNVWEWCQDLYAPGGGAAAVGREPRDSGDADRERVIRGGSWNLDAWSARCSRRFGFREDYFGSGLGFRLAASAM